MQNEQKNIKHWSNGFKHCRIHTFRRSSNDRVISVIMSGGIILANVKLQQS